MVPQYLIDYILKTKNVARHHEQVISGTVYIREISRLYNAKCLVI